MKDYLLSTLETDYGNDVTALVTLRYRLESDPDIDASYTPVTATKVVAGVTVYDFDITLLAEETYIVHQYYTADGSGTGVKYKLEITEDVLP